MVVMPTGSFRMGSNSGDSDENPVHRVTISKPFALGKYEVTFKEYAAFARATKRELPDDEGWGGGNRPVINVSWQDAQAYVQWLSKKTGKRYRLPSESEWEYSARAGSTTKYSWGDSIGSNKANCNRCGSQWDGKKTAPAGSFSANSFGLHDMHGNVFEWVEDCYQDSYKKTPANGEPHLGGACSDRVLRGGSWNYLPSYLRSADRNWYTASERYFHSGFRVAQDLEKDADREG